MSTWEVFVTLPVNKSSAQVKTGRAFISCRASVIRRWDIMFYIHYILVITVSNLS